MYLKHKGDNLITKLRTDVMNILHEETAMNATEVDHLIIKIHIIKETDHDLHQYPDITLEIITIDTAIETEHVNITNKKVHIKLHQQEIQEHLAIIDHDHHPLIKIVTKVTMIVIGLEVTLHKEEIEWKTETIIIKDIILEVDHTGEVTPMIDITEKNSRTNYRSRSHSQADRNSQRTSDHETPPDQDFKIIKDLAQRNIFCVRCLSQGHLTAKCRTYSKTARYPCVTCNQNAYHFHHHCKQGKDKYPN